MQRVIARQIPLGTRLWCRGRWYRLASKTMRGEGRAGPYFDLEPLGPYPEKRGVSFRVCLLEEPVPTRPAVATRGDAVAAWRKAITQTKAPIPIRPPADDPDA